MMNLACVCLSVLLAAGAVLPSPAPEEPEPEPTPPALLYDDTDFVLHAGGITPEGRAGSNSLEALNHS